MPVTIRQNGIALSDKRAGVEGAIRDAIGGRPGEWEVWIDGPRLDPYYIISMTGPEGFQLRLNLFGPFQQAPENIRNEIAAALPKERQKNARAGRTRLGLLE